MPEQQTQANSSTPKAAKRKESLSNGRISIYFNDPVKWPDDFKELVEASIERR